MSNGQKRLFVFTPKQSQPVTLKGKFASIPEALKVITQAQTTTPEHVLETEPVLAHGTEIGTLYTVSLFDGVCYGIVTNRGTLPLDVINTLDALALGQDDTPEESEESEPEETGTNTVGLTLTPEQGAWWEHALKQTEASDVRLIGQVISRLSKGNANTADKALIRAWGLGLALESCGIEKVQDLLNMIGHHAKAMSKKPKKGTKGGGSQGGGDISLYSLDWTTVKEKISTGQAQDVVFHVIRELVQLVGRGGKVEAFESQGKLYLNLRYLSKTGGAKVKTCLLTPEAVKSLEEQVQRDVRALSVTEVRCHKLALKLQKKQLSELSESDRKFYGANTDRVEDARKALKALS